MQNSIGWGGNFVLMRYGNEWRERRKMFHDTFNVVTVPEYLEKQIRHAQLVHYNFQ
jgi:hypothetical protein